MRGVVQGVGFRPFVHGLASRLDLGGHVLNDGEGVTIEVEGDAGALERFASALGEETPRLARIEEVSWERIAALGQRTFTIAESAGSTGTALVPPDVATCDDCLRELHDPADRRFRYPFVNCTQCGPRFTIVRSVPYDRPNTVMSGFPLCEDCRREYEDPADRRFHAEPIACPACGPQLTMPLETAVRLLRDGAIVAVKGLGGYHLACDATRRRRRRSPAAAQASRREALRRHERGAGGHRRARRRDRVAPPLRRAADRPRPP